MEQGKLDKLKRKIIADAESEASKIIEEGKSEASRILEEAKTEAERIRQEFEARAKEEASEYVRRQVSLRELEARKAVLAEKGKVIDEVFARALESLRQKDRESGYGITWKLLLSAVEAGDEEIILDAEDRKALPPDFLDRLNGELKRQGKRGEVKLCEDSHSIKGGFILKRARSESNSTFDTLLGMVRDEIETEISQVLFGGKVKEQGSEA